MKQLSCEPPGKTPGPSRPNHPPKLRERDVGQDAGPVSNQILCRSATSEPSGKTPGPSRIESSAEAPRASRRARRRARLESNPPPKRHERAVGQDTGPVSNGILRRSAASEPSGKTPGPPRTICRSDTRAIRRASHCRGAAYDPALKPQLAGAADTELNPLDYSL